MNVKNLSLGKALSRDELKAVIGGNMPLCRATDLGATRNCPTQPDGSAGCWVSCYVTCTDTCGNTGTACASDWVCG